MFIGVLMFSLFLLAAIFLTIFNELKDNRIVYGLMSVVFSVAMGGSAYFFGMKNNQSDWEIWAAQNDCGYFIFNDLNEPEFVLHPEYDLTEE